MMALITSCTTDSLDSVVNFENETFEKDSYPIAGKNSWESYGVVRLENRDSVFIGNPYNLHYASGSPIKVYLDDLTINKVRQIGPITYHVEVNSLLDIFIEGVEEDENTLRFSYTLKSELKEYNMNSFSSFKFEKTDGKESNFISGLEELISIEESQVEGKWKPVGGGVYLAFKIIKYLIEKEKEESCTDQAIRACGGSGVAEVHSSFGKCSFKCK